MTTAVEAATAARRAVKDVATGRALLAFYAGVLAVALVGSTQGVEHWIGWSTPASFWATALAELGGVTLNIFADRRRQLGERALAARLLGAAFAAGAIAVQLRGHADDAGHITATGLFFAGFSLAGYVIYLLDSAAKRRDALRLAGKLAETPPAYGVYQWARHPWLTARARRLAVANAEVRLVERITSREQGRPDRPTTALLGRAASLAAAVAEVAEERRLAAIGKSLRGRIAAGVDPTMATIAVNTFDLARVAEGIAQGADYPALTELLAAELTPARIAAGVTARHRRGRTWRWFGWLRRPETTMQTNELVAAITGETDQETAETAAETVETAAETAETDPAPAWPGAAPTGARLLPIVAAAAPAPEPIPTPEPAATIVVPPLPRPMARRAPEPEALAPAADEPLDQVDEADLAEASRLAREEGERLALPPVDPSLLPHLARVMAAHRDWAVSIGMPSRHPDALTYKKIKDAAGINGQQLCADIRTALLSLRVLPEAAEAHVGVPEPATATA